MGHSPRECLKNFNPSREKKHETHNGASSQQPRSPRLTVHKQNEKKTQGTMQTCWPTRWRVSPTSSAETPLVVESTRTTVKTAAAVPSCTELYVRRLSIKLRSCSGTSQTRHVKSLFQTLKRWPCCLCLITKSLRVVHNVPTIKHQLIMGSGKPFFSSI